MAASPSQVPWSLHAIIAAIVDKLVWICALVPYGAVALLLRIVMSRVFFLAGQEKIRGPHIPLHVGLPGSGFSLLDMTVVLPAQIKDTTLQLFETHYAYAPVPPAAVAYVVTYVEFIAPICLFIGFGTRFAAFGLLALTMLLQIYVAPDLWWSHHVYWVCLLLTLIALGPGSVSIDALLRYLYEREQPVQ
jgi:putative oxidoreductase